MRILSLLVGCLMCGTALAEPIVPLTETFSTTPEGCTLYQQGGEPAVLASAGLDTMVIDAIGIYAKNLSCSVEAISDDQIALRCDSAIGSKVRTVTIESNPEGVTLTDNNGSEAIPRCPQ